MLLEQHDGKVGRSDNAAPFHTVARAANRLVQWLF